MSASWSAFSRYLAALNPEKTGGSTIAILAMSASKPSTTKTGHLHEEITRITQDLFVMEVLRWQARFVAAVGEMEGLEVLDGIHPWRLEFLSDVYSSKVPSGASFLRLGAWLGNPGPAGDKTFQLGYPHFSVGPIIAEAFGVTNDTSPYVYLSDGGHLENLGLYEMVLRRCH